MVRGDLYTGELLLCIRYDVFHSLNHTMNPKLEATP